jgi:CNT family concentrative nucleoside transporter
MTPSHTTLRAAAFGAAAALGGLAWLLAGVIGPRGQAACGAACFIAVSAACSSDLRAVRWRTVAWGIAIQLALALFILRFQVGGLRPGYAFFSAVGDLVKRFLEFSNQGAAFVFGPLANPGMLETAFGAGNGFVFAVTALPTIIFISSFFTILYHFGVLQVIVWVMARAMMYALRTSGAETLSAAANVFMGQTEAPIIVKPYVPEMTRSELLALMVGGMATISGGVMAVYIGLGADPVAILTTSVMAAPCGLYLSKLLLPEREAPRTAGAIALKVERQHVNVIDAASAGAGDGLMLALNVAAMLIAFLALIALADAALGWAWPGLTLARVFSIVFAPAAFLMGVPVQDVGAMADLLGTKLVANEFVAFVKLTGEYRGQIDPRTHVLATYALTGFANLGSIGIQLGGIGAMAPTRRPDLARLGSRALLAGFLATLINACVASMLL